ncbi:MAG TPA: TolC family protein [Rhizomicrobium sp.]
MRQTAAAALLAMLLTMPASADDLAPPRPDTPWRGDSYVLPPGAPVPLPQAPQGIDPRHAYSLSELIDIAQSANPQTRVAWDQARIAAQSAGIAEAAFLPNLSAVILGGYQTGRDRSTLTTLHGESATGVVSALTLQWLLFDFGQRSALLEAARQHATVSDIAFTAEHQAVIYKVSLAYYASAAARIRARNAAVAEKDAREIQAAAEDRLRHGIATTLEVAQARQATAQAELSLVEADGAAEDARVTVLAAMGISPLAKIVIADPPQHDLNGSVLPDVERLVAAALGRRTDVLGASAGHGESLARLDAAQAEYLPKLFVAATGSYASGSLDAGAFSLADNALPSSNLAANRSGVTVFVGIKIPIYDGGVRDAAVEQARADADRTAALADASSLEAARQIVAASNAVKTSLAAHAAARALEAAAQTTFDAALASYRHGVGSITDAMAAEIQLLGARNAVGDAGSTALAAAATLAFATGILGSAPP